MQPSRLPFPSNFLFGLMNEKDSYSLEPEPINNVNTARKVKNDYKCFLTIINI